MLSVSSFNQHCKGNIITVRGKSDIPCPVCSGFLKVHGTCIRKVRLIDATRVYRLRVMECTNCHRTHRELPDFIVPYKRYGTEAIIDIVELPTDQCVCETSTQAMCLGVNFVELEIDSRGSYFHILVGRHRYGNFICIPNWNIGTEIAELTDRFWNLERITNYYPKLHKVDAISIVDGLVAVGSILNSKKQDI